MKQLAQGIVNPVIPSNLGSGGNATGPSAVGEIISGFVGAFLIFAFFAAVFYLLLGGFTWITSGGDKAKLQASRDEITNAIIGLIVVGAAWAVMTLVGGFLGIEFPNLVFPTIGQ